MSRAWTGRAARTASVLACVVALGATTAIPAGAIQPPVIPADPVVPPDPPPAPVPMRQDKPCNLPGVLPTPPVGDIPAAAGMLGLDQAHKFSTGAGVTVAVIDTGVAPNPRLPRLLPGGDYVGDTGGIGDCDMHGTLIAAEIAGTAGPGDQFVGVAPDATILSIRQSSQLFSPSQPQDSGNPTQQRQIDDVAALAASIVRAANAGARVINISVVACVAAAHPINQDALAVAVRYAAVIKDVVLIAAAGNNAGDGGNQDCQNNPGYDPLSPPSDARNWDHVINVSIPSLFSDYVISVGSVDGVGTTGTASSFSMTGPWVDLAAPGTNIVSLGPDGTAINALPGPNGLVNIFGTSFSAAYVSGLAALVRSKYPDLTAAQVRHRLEATAHTGPRGVDDTVGYGLIDPVAALTYDLPPGSRTLSETHRRVLVVAPDPVPVNHWPQWWSLIASAAILAAALIVIVAVRARRGQR